MPLGTFQRPEDRGRGGILSAQQQAIQQLIRFREMMSQARQPGATPNPMLSQALSRTQPTAPPPPSQARSLQTGPLSPQPQQSIPPPAAAPPPAPSLAQSAPVPTAPPRSGVPWVNPATGARGMAGTVRPGQGTSIQDFIRFLMLFGGDTGGAGIGPGIGSGGATGAQAGGFGPGGADRGFTNV